MQQRLISLDRAKIEETVHISRLISSNWACVILLIVLCYCSAKSRRYWRYINYFNNALGLYSLLKQITICGFMQNVTDSPKKLILNFHKLK